MEEHGKVMEELVRGHEFANQLRQVINEDDKSATTTPFAQDFVNNVIRKTTQTWEKFSEIPNDDGHQWRKYGQKAILHAKYSRTYYRCTYKFDQRCQAIKQVQRIQEDPPLYKTTYYGHHTCKNLLSPEILLYLNSALDTSVLVSSDNTFSMPTKQDSPFSSSCLPSLSVKKECIEDVPSLSTLDNYSKHVTLSSILESNHMDVKSGVLYDSLELDDVFQTLLDFNDQLGVIQSLN